MTPVYRLPGWERQLSAILATHRGRAFDWGEHDCCLAACSIIAAITGVDPACPEPVERAENLRGTYHDRASAGALLRHHGGLESLAETRFARFGWPRIETLFAQRGDCALVPTPIGSALGIVIGRDIACTGIDGLVTVPLSTAQAAWAIGRDIHPSSLIPYPS